LGWTFLRMNHFLSIAFTSRKVHLLSFRQSRGSLCCSSLVYRLYLSSHGEGHPPAIHWRIHTHRFFLLRAWRKCSALLHYIRVPPLSPAGSLLYEVVAFYAFLRTLQNSRTSYCSALPTVYISTAVLWLLLTSDSLALHHCRVAASKFMPTVHYQISPGKNAYFHSIYLPHLH
jgi:hypothetical protein